MGKKAGKLLNVAKLSKLKKLPGHGSSILSVSGDDGAVTRGLYLHEAMLYHTCACMHTEWLLGMPCCNLQVPQVHIKAISMCAASVLVPHDQEGTPQPDDM